MEVLLLRLHHKPKMDSPLKQVETPTAEVNYPMCTQRSLLPVHFKGLAENVPLDHVVWRNPVSRAQSAESREHWHAWALAISSSYHMTATCHLPHLPYALLAFPSRGCILRSLLYWSSNFTMGWRAKFHFMACLAERQSCLFCCLIPNKKQQQFPLHEPRPASAKTILCQSGVWAVMNQTLSPAGWWVFHICVVYHGELTLRWTHG